MKLYIASTLLAAMFVATPALAGDMGSMNASDHAAKGAASQSARTVGIVKAIDPAKGSATISHEAIPSLNWPSMKMGFKVTPEMSAGLKVGQSIEFEFVMQGRDAVITKIVSVK